MRLGEMRDLSVRIDCVTRARMQLFARESGRDIEDLIECAISEAALSAFRSRTDDPARHLPVTIHRDAGAHLSGEMEWQLNDG